MQSGYERRVAAAQTPVSPEPSIRIQGEIASWLNRCLRAELSAVETYDLAARKMEREELSNVLRQIRASHEQRAVILREFLLAAGVEPSQGSGVWGTFAKAVQAGADLLGDRSALTALEQFEDHTSSLYTDLPYPVDEKTRGMLDVLVLPEQRRTSDLSHTLLHFVQSH